MGLLATLLTPEELMKLTSHQVDVLAGVLEKELHTNATVHGLLSTKLQEALKHQPK